MERRELFTEQFEAWANGHIRTLLHQGTKIRVPALIGDRYEPRRILSVGGMGLLLIASDRRLFDREVLIKTPLTDRSWFCAPNDRALVEGIEAQKQAAEHERKMFLHARWRNLANVPTLIDWCEDLNPMVRGPHRADDGTEFTVGDRTLWGTWPYLVVGYVGANPLNQVVTSNPRWVTRPLAQAKNLGIQVGNILQQFHMPLEFRQSKNLAFLYLDLKPENILMTPEGRAILIDLGSLRPFADGKLGGDAPALTETYMAPEFEGRLAPAPHPSMDVYSLGVVIEECLQNARKRPINVAEPPDTTLPEPWRTFLDTCRHRTVTRRFQNMKWLISALIELPIEEYS